MTEEVFVRAWEALPKYQVSESRFTSWLYTITHNLLVDDFRRSYQVTNLADDFAHHPDTCELPERTVGRKQEYEILAKSIQQLDDLEQQVLLLRFVEELSHREIAKIIGKNQTASRVIQHRALKVLPTLLACRGFLNV
jgi:RNA polymerase sigma-70 factor (ECF subfamily)